MLAFALHQKRSRIGVDRALNTLIDHKYPWGDTHYGISFNRLKRQLRRLPSTDGHRFNESGGQLEAC
jgi:hypothetical protein